MMQPQFSQAQWRRERRIVLCCYGLLLFLVGLHFYVRTLPATLGALPEMDEAEAMWWGFWPVRYVADWAFWLGVAAVIATMASGLWQIFTPIGNSDNQRRNNKRSWTTRSIEVAFLLLLVYGFFIFPIVHTRWGDSYIIANALAWPDPALRLTHSWQAPLDVFVHSQLWLALHQRFQWATATPVYAFLSPVAGCLYLFVVLRLGHMQEIAPSWLTVGLLSSLGVMQLFFGYVENYSFAAAGIVAYLWFGLGVLNGRRPLWQAASVLALLNATHPSTIVLGPSLLFATWAHWHKQRFSAWRVLAEMAVPLLLVAGCTFWLMEAGGHGLAALLGDDRPGGGDGRWLVPLFVTTTRWEHYTLFSWPHLRDFLNEQVLVAPVVVPTLLLLWVGTFRTGLRSIGTGLSTEEKHAGYFLLLASICYWLFVWLWNPDYGGQRDWDLFSLSTIPSTLLLAWALPRFVTLPRMLRAGALPLILFQALHTGAWVYQNRWPWHWPG